MDIEFTDRLKKLLAEPLPGRKAQYEMAPSTRRLYYNLPPKYKSAAVLLLLYPKRGIWYVVFIKRKRNIPGDRHAGQISLPGGKLETTDSSLEECALRETREELGIDEADIQVIGPLTELYVFVSDFLVQPYLGCLPYAPTFVPQYEEVEDVLEIPLHHLLHPSAKKKKDLVVRERRLKGVPYFDLFGHTLWGATAMIVNELIHILGYKDQKHHIDQPN